MKNEQSLCIGVATFEIDGEAKQFGLTQEDFEMLAQRAEKLQESINSITNSLKRFSEEKARLESELTAIRQPQAPRCLNKSDVIAHVYNLAKQGKQVCDESCKGVYLRLPYTSELISCDELLNQFRAQVL